MDKISEIPKKLGCLWEMAAQKENDYSISLSPIEYEAFAKKRAYVERMKKTEMRLFLRRAASLVIRLFFGMAMLAVVLVAIIAVG